MAHEFGHGTGGLADEYCAAPAPTAAASRVPWTSRSTPTVPRLKWGKFINPTTPVPTGHGRRRAPGTTRAPKPAGWSDDQDVGLFEGGNTTTRGIYRPVINCRMRGNAPAVLPGLLHADEAPMRPVHRAQLPQRLRRRLQRRRQGRRPRPQRQLDPCSSAPTAPSSTSPSAPWSACPARGSSSPTTSSSSATSTATARTRSPSTTARLGHRVPRPARRRRRRGLRLIARYDDEHARLAVPA